MSRQSGLSRAELIVLGFFGLFLAAGLGILAQFWSVQQLSKRVQGWPSVAGKVLSAQMHTGRGSKSTLYSARITYDYEVKGHHHRGHRVYLDAVSTSNFSDAQAILNAFPAGKTVLVYYDPSDPSESVLRRSSGGGSWIMLLGGSVFTLMGIACPWLLFVRRKA